MGALLQLAHELLPGPAKRLIVVDEVLELGVLGSDLNLYCFISCKPDWLSICYAPFFRPPS